MPNQQFGVLSFPVLSNSEHNRHIFVYELAQGLKNVFEETNYIKFVSLLYEVLHNLGVVWYIISHKVKFCDAVHKSYKDMFQKLADIARAEPYDEARDEYYDEARDEYIKDWNINATLVLTERPVAHTFIFNQHKKSIAISPVRSTNLEIREERFLTSDLMVMFSTIMNSPVAQVNNIENLPRNPDLRRFLMQVMNNPREITVQYFLDNFYINVDNDEEWGYR